MANPAPTINQINAFNATQGTTIDFNIIGGTELVRSNRIYIYDLSDNSLICTHLYVSTESIHELPPNTDGSIVYESGKSSADFVNGAQYYAQIQTFTDIAGTEGGSGLSVAKMFWCLVDPTLTIDAIPSTISTTSYNVSATYNANTSVVSNIIQQYQFSLYSATGSLLQSSGVVVGSGEQQGTSTAYDISYNFTGLSVGSSYYVTVEVTTTQGMNVNTQSNTFTISIDTPTLGEATVVNNACDGYISVTSNLSGEYGGSGSGEIVSFETDSENVFTKLQVDLDPVQDLHGYDAPWVGGVGKNKLQTIESTGTINDVTYTVNSDGSVTLSGTASNNSWITVGDNTMHTATELGFVNGQSYIISGGISTGIRVGFQLQVAQNVFSTGSDTPITFDSAERYRPTIYVSNGTATNVTVYPMVRLSTVADNTWQPYSNICPISGWSGVDVARCGINVWDEDAEVGGINVNTGATTVASRTRSKNYIPCVPNTSYYWKLPSSSGLAVCYYDASKTFVSGAWVFENQAHTTPANAYFMKFCTGDAYGTTYNNDISINYPSTDHEYHSYQGESFHQDIEVTYTPTVQENEAYLFKQTEDVGGDRETIELVGGTVAWNQLIKNNIGSWAIYSGTATKTLTDTTLELVASTSNLAVAQYFRSEDDFVENHRYLSYGEIKSSVAGMVCDSYNGSPFNGVTTSTNWKQKACLFTPLVRGSAFTGVKVSSGADNGTLYLRNMMVIDLTQMFGTTIADYIYSIEQATAGAGVAWFKKLFPKPYYAYNAGELMSVNAVSHNMVGFNAFDVDNADLQQKEWANIYTVSTNVHTEGYTKVIGGATYCFHQNIETQGRYIRFYDADYSFLQPESISIYNNNDHIFTVPANAMYLRLMWYDANGVSVAEVADGDICINLSWDGERDGEYEEYVKHSYPLDSDLELRGIPKLDASNNLYYDGDTYESDGTVTRRYGIVDLGTLTWTYYSDYQMFYTVVSGKANGLKNLLCAKYPVVGASGNIWNTIKDKQIEGNSSNGTIYIRDTSLGTDATAFKTAMNGVYLVYELATATSETADAFESIQKVTPNYGTEEFVSSTIVPVGNNTQYLTRDIYGGTLDLVSGVLTVTWANSQKKLSEMTTLTPLTNCDRYRIHAPFASVATETSTLWKCDTLEYKLNNLDNPHFYYSATQDNIELFVPRGMDANTKIHFVAQLATPTTYQLTPQQIQTLVGQNNVWSEQGDIELAYHIPITNLLVKRQDVDDVSGSWLTLYSQPITQASDMDFTFIDFTNQYGKTYKYALVPLLTQTQSGVEVEVEGGYTVSDEVQSVFDGVFIVDSTGSQKCKANVGYGNVDMNQTVGTITPIGAKYPVVITNSKNQYHNGSISGTIVPDDYYFNGNLSRIDMVNKRDELEQFLTNKRAKIIKDWNGKIWLVMIMDNVSCTFNNNYGMGIVNFSTNWVEVGDPTNQQDLQATGLINVGGV